MNLDRLLDRRKKIVVSHQALHSLLGLPADARIVAIQSSIDPPSFQVVAICPRWEEIPPGSEAPYAAGAWSRTQLATEDGKIYWRMEWDEIT